MKTALQKTKTRKGYMATSLVIDQEGAIYTFNEPITFWYYYSQKLSQWLYDRN